MLVAVWFPVKKATSPYSNFQSGTEALFSFADSGFFAMFPKFPFWDHYYSLQTKSILIGKEIDPGVPATVSVGTPIISLVLKSGNFGSVDFFEKAFKQMP